ncbi:hypothetical protein AB6A40_001169 [Gnathostoma spinigerum]|uniref:Protein phosphatase n=1 Tax=Gnathostoma spinigerum TaxID=75299 RepID=A0ABD6EDR6_9BILA
MIHTKHLARCSRIIARAIISASVFEHNITTPRECLPSVSSARSAANISGNTKQDSKPAHKVYATCCGFPKDMVNGPSVVLDHGVFGDDACFISKYRNTHVVGVADGVGGWRRYGVDPSAFSRRLMRICSDLVESGDFEPCRPDILLAHAFQTLSTPPRPIGSSTACVLVVHQGTLYSANLGDSGYCVLREGSIICRSREQVHYFNAPFQLSLPPENLDVYTGFIGDPPDRAELQTLPLKSGDLIVLATDGLWDNVGEDVIVKQLARIKPGDLQAACNALALTARRLAFDTHQLSPFAIKASLHGIDAPGGKPDDITLVLVFIA